MSKPTLAEIDKLVNSVKSLNAAFAGSVVDHAGVATLPLAGVSLYDTPVYQFLKTSLVYAPGSPLEQQMRITAAIANTTPITDGVLITGPTGVGKETFARAFAERKPGSPFVAVNCTGLPDYLVESELFGHVAGSFTGAVKDKTGLFVKATGGVLFLDEIGDMPLSLQPKLLRVLQQRTVRPVGSNDEVSINCRVVVATNRNLRDSTFREDLYWRISTHVIEILALRNRQNDLFEYLDRRVELKQRDEVRPLFFNDNGILKQDLPGNYREVQQILSRYRLRKYLDGIGTPPAK